MVIAMADDERRPIGLLRCEGGPFRWGAGFYELVTLSCV